MNPNLIKAIDALFVKAAMDAMEMVEGELTLHAVVIIRDGGFSITMNHEAAPIRDEEHLDQLAAEIRAGWR